MNMGFKTEEEYNTFMREKMEQLIKMIVEDPKLIGVFKRLKDK